VTEFQAFYNRVVEDYARRGERLPPKWQIEDLYDGEYYGYRRDDPDRWRFLKECK